MQKEFKKYYETSKNQRGSSEVEESKEQEDNDPNGLKELCQYAEELGSKLTQVLTPEKIDQVKFKETLRSLGQVSKEVYESSEDFLEKNQIKEITEKTQTMLRIGTEFKSNPEIDSPEKRKALLSITFSLVETLKEISVERELSDLLG